MSSDLHGHAAEHACLYAHNTHTSNNNNNYCFLKWKIHMIALHTSLRRLFTSANGECSGFYFALFSCFSKLYLWQPDVGMDHMVHMFVYVEHRWRICRSALYLWVILPPPHRPPPLRGCVQPVRGDNLPLPATPSHAHAPSSPSFAACRHSG